MKTNEFAGSKLAVLYFSGALDLPLTNGQITEFFVTKYIFNYFDLQQLLAELQDSEHLQLSECRNNQYYHITDKGREAVELFKSHIDPDTREMIDGYVRDHRTRLKNESQLTADYRKIDDENYEVALKVMEMDKTVMEITLFVLNSGQAKTVCSQWMSKAPRIYKTIMEALIE